MLTEKSIIKKINFFDSPEQTYSSIAIHFLTGSLDEQALKKMFGDPLYHSEFGEGFDGEYDDETDEYSEPEIKEFYATYFVEIDGVTLHIGYDHRGTGIEIESNYNMDGHITKTEAEKCLKTLKKLVDIFKERV